MLSLYFDLSQARTALQAPHQPNHVLQVTIVYTQNALCNNYISSRVGSYCPASSSSPTPCPAGNVYLQGDCMLLTYNVKNLLLNTGTSLSSSGASTLTQCVTCSSGYFSTSGAVSCALCATMSSSYATNTLPTHWVGGPLKSQCKCTVGWTGDNCEYNRCSKYTQGLSLGAMLFFSDPRIRQYSINFNSSNIEQMKAVKSYVSTLLKTSVDINGDGNITVTEMTDALKYRSVWSSSMSNLPLWCRSATCNIDKTSILIETKKLYNDAINNFLTSPKHTFDGSGIPIITSLSSTYPSPTWTDAQCRSCNPRWFPKTYQRVMTTWNWISDSAKATATRVCGYSNGLFNPAFVTTSVLSGTQTSFRDNVDVSENNLFKRVYCISVDYSEQTDYECAVGLFYVRINKISHNIYYRY